MGQRVFLKEYDFNLTAGGIAIVLAEAEYFRIQASSGPVSIMIDGLGELPNLQAGQGIKSTPFKRLTIRDVSGAANVGRILVSNQEFIDNRTYGVNSLDAATIASMKRPDVSGAFFSISEAPLANTTTTVFLAAANVNGAIIHSANVAEFSTAMVRNALIAKATAPTQITGEEVLMLSKASSFGNTYYFGGGDLTTPQRIAAGKGLYFFTVDAQVGSLKSVRYTLL